MRRRPPHSIELTPADQLYLENLARAGRTPLRLARRARVLLAMADPQTVVQDLARQWEQSRNSIWYLCRRYEAAGLAAVCDAPRSGRPLDISPLGAGSD
jgi:hypothetical protein